LSFLSSLFLWALPLAAVPIVIHLLHRRRRQVVRWGAMQLLLESAPRKRRIWQINDLLLMILRALAVAAVILAFSRPQVRSGLLSGRSPGRDVILIVDASLSTGRLHAGVPVFDKIRQTAREAIDHLDASDHVRLMLAASAPHWLGGDAAVAVARDEIVKQLSAIKPTLAAADMPACVQSALLSEAPADATSRMIVVVTDGAAHGWNADAGPRWEAVREIATHASIPTSISVVAAEKSKSPFANLSIEKLATNRTRVAVGESFAVTARVRNTGDVAREATSLKWEIDGQPAGESPVVALEPGQSSDVTFELAYDQPGAFSLTGRLGRDDDLPGDNATSIVVESIDRLPILVCRREADLERPPSQPDFLKAALGRGPEGPRSDYSISIFEPTFIGLDALAGSDLSQYRCVILDDVLPKSSEAVDRLFDFAAKGGGVWLILGEHVTAEQFNATVFRDGNGLVPLTLGQRLKAGDDRGSFFTVHPPEGTHPATVLLGDTERLDIDDVRISQHWQLSTPDSADDAAVLLETGDGAPLAVEHFAGEGRIIVLGMPTDTAWSNLSICQVFVPLVQEWVWYLTQPTATNYNLDPGAPIVLSSQRAARQKNAQIRTPLGQTATLATDKTGGSELRYRETVFPGNYLMTFAATDAPGLRIPFSVRRDPQESQLTPLSAEQIAALTKGGGLQFTTDVLHLPENPTKSIRYTPFWGYLVGLVAVLFLAELVCTHLLTKRRSA
jgi:hypothetical protein